MENVKKIIWILHAGIQHPSPYFYNFCKELNNYDDYEYIVNPNLPINKKITNGIVYFNRLKRFYKSDDIKTAETFLKDIDTLIANGWKIVWTLHNFFPIDRKITNVDEFVTKEFIKKCNIVFTVSEYMKRSIKKHYNVNAINHGMGINTLNDYSINNDVKNIKKSNLFTFTFIGNIYKYKLLDKIVESFNNLDNCRLIIAGSESKNAEVNIEKLIEGNKKITYINSFINNNDWKKLSEITDTFISLYDLNLPAFKYGFFPSNFINIARTGIKCITPKSNIFKEMIYNYQMIYYDFSQEDGLLNAMKKAIKMKEHRIKPKIKYKYSWEKTIKIFTDSCNKLF